MESLSISSKRAVLVVAAATGIAALRWLRTRQKSMSDNNEAQPLKKQKVEKEAADSGHQKVHTKVPPIFDPHHHFFEPDKNAFQSWVKNIGVPAYLPEQYTDDAKGLDILGSVHVEGIPNSGQGAEEVAWVESLAKAKRCKVKAIVASVDLAAGKDAVDKELTLVKSKSDKVRGIRWILDYDGPFSKDGENATHIACSRHDKDYLRDKEARANFEIGFALLAKHGLSFDLQCCPAQLLAAAELFKKYPQVKVVVDHLGKPRHLAKQGFGKDGALLPADEKEVATWRAGMKALAALPQVHVKLSMLAYSVPNWVQDEAKERLVKSLVREVISMFGPKRCMFASNWFINGFVSNSDGADQAPISMFELFQKFADWVTDMSPEDQAALFSGSAKAFYRA
eukprot:g7781.t1